MAHKRPGRTAKNERIHRVIKRKPHTVVVHFPKKWDPERIDHFSPGQCVAWADGRIYNDTAMEG